MRASDDLLRSNIDGNENPVLGAQETQSVSKVRRGRRD
jgi:hypothetical protein